MYDIYTVPMQAVWFARREENRAKKEKGNILPGFQVCPPHTHTHMRARAGTHRRMHTHTDRYTHARTHARTHACTHVHTHTQPVPVSHKIENKFAATMTTWLLEE